MTCRPDTKRATTAFVDGINAFVELTRRNPVLLPVEFRGLGYEPEFWEPADVARIRSHGLFYNLREEVSRARTLRDMPREVVCLGRRTTTDSLLCRIVAGLRVERRVAMRSWTARQWIVAGIVAVAAALVMGLATAIIENPVFMRMIPTPWWAYPVWITSAVLLGSLAGTYVTPQRQGAPSSASQRRQGLGGAVLAWFAVGCPTCNMLVVAALGTSGAVTWFQPVQPVLAAVSLILLAGALRSRLRNAGACAVRPRG